MGASQPPFNFMPKENIVLDEEDIVNTEKGKIIQVSYSINRDMGNFIHRKVELTSTVGESEDIEDVYKYLQDEAQYLLYLND